ncbi:MAG: PEP-CTERM sorting domain-containing protein, partial [Verrucomicrobiota bacterium]
LRVAIGTAPTPWNRRSEPSQGLTHGKVLNLASAYLDGSTTANSPSSGIIQNTSTTYDWSDFQPGGSQSTANTSFAVYSPGIEGNFGNGAAGTRLDLFQLTPGSGAGTNEGYFAIADTGTISFVAPIPEPGSFVMLLVAGCGMMGFTRHRKSLSA